MGFRQMRRWRVRFFVEVSNEVEFVLGLGGAESVGICCCLVERVGRVQGEVLVFHRCRGDRMGGRWS